MLKFLKEFGGAIVITRQEDKLLNKKGLRQKMPKGFSWTDRHARYKVCGIKISKHHRCGY